MLGENSKMFKKNTGSSRVLFEAREIAFAGRIFQFAIVNDGHIDIIDFLNDSFHVYEPQIAKYVNKYKMIKTNAVLKAEFEKKISSASNNDPNCAGGSSNNGNADAGENNVTVVTQTMFLASPLVLLTIEDSLQEHYELNVINEMVRRIEDQELYGSGFSLSRIIELNVNACEAGSLDGSSYLPLPAKLVGKRAVINVRNENDNECFKWAILSALHQFRNPQRIDWYHDFEGELNFDGIQFPVSLHQVDKFVNQNDNISINVYYYDGQRECICPLRVSQTIKENHIRLLLITEGDDDNDTASATTSNTLKTALFIYLFIYYN